MALVDSGKSKVLVEKGIVKGKLSRVNGELEKWGTTSGTASVGVSGKGSSGGRAAPIVSGGAGGRKKKSDGTEEEDDSDGSFQNESE